MHTNLSVCLSGCVRTTAFVACLPEHSLTGGPPQQRATGRPNVPTQADRQIPLFVPPAVCVSVAVCLYEHSAILPPTGCICLLLIHLTTHTQVVQASCLMTWTDARQPSFDPFLPLPCCLSCYLCRAEGSPSFCRRRRPQSSVDRTTCHSLTQSVTHTTCGCMASLPPSLCCFASNGLSVFALGDRSDVHVHQ